MKHKTKGAVADEVITAIRTVFAFNGAQKEHKRYFAHPKT